MKILLLSRYGYQGASSRYRSYQYLPYLQQAGFNITIAPFLDDIYLKNLYSGKRASLMKILSAYADRIFKLLRYHQYDLIWLEKEALPWIPASLELFLLNRKVPYVVDYDDAVFHRYDQHNSQLVRGLMGRKIEQIMSKAKLVIVGNDYLKKRAIDAGAKRVEILPTVIDLERYPLTTPLQNNIFTIGWIGSPMKSYNYLNLISSALREMCRKGEARLIAIGAEKRELEGVNMEVKQWSEATEVEEMQAFDVGIMPLTDTPFEQGKCGFKLIQYMACFCPVIGSPIGINSQIIDHGINGFQAKNIDDWIEAFNTLKNQPNLRKKMGVAGRKTVEEKYCLQKTAPKLLTLLKQ